ncbi:hypothetical protein L6R52_04835 [Myxococcota bacterium]|nr:hypothetical protein [Myxococcota bacterium]
MSEPRLSSSLDVEPGALRSTRAPLPRSTGTAVFVASTFLAALGLASSAAGWAMLRVEHLARSEADLEQAARAHAEVVAERERGLFVAGHALADDARVRSTLSVAEVDDATISDILADLGRTTSLPLLAVLDADGRVRGIAGPEELRGADLGGTSAVKRARESDGPSSGLWTLKQSAVSVTVHPVRLASGGRSYLVLGADVSKGAAERLAKTFEADVALVVGHAPAFSSGRLADPAHVDGALAGRGAEAHALRVETLSEGPTPVRMIWVSTRSAGVTPVGAIVLVAPSIVGIFGAAGLWSGARRRAPRQERA